MSSVPFDAAPNGRIVGRYAGGNVLVGVHLLVFESARFTLEASPAVNAESREHLSLPELISDAPKVPVECRYLLSILNRPKFIKLVLILVQFPFPEGSQSIIKHALSNEFFRNNVSPTHVIMPSGKSTADNGGVADKGASWCDLGLHH